MKLRYLLFLPLSIAIGSLHAQSLGEVVRQILNITTERKLTIPQYFELTKRFAKLDVHPSIPRLAIPGRQDSLQAKSVSNYIWGVVAHEVFKIPINEAQMYPGAITKDGNKNKKMYIEDLFWKNRFEFISLVNNIQKSQSKVFMQHIKSLKDSYVRIDNVFREKDSTYWQYCLPAGAQFTFSNDRDTLKNFSFTTTDQSILDKLNKLNIYCAYKEQDKVIFIISGLLDNMIGYIYSKEQIDKTMSSPSLHVSLIEPAGENFYYYVSN